MRASARASTLNSLASMVSMTVSLASSTHGGQIAPFAGEVAPGLLEPVESAAVDQHARNDVEPFVARGAGDAGKLRRRLAVGEDLLDDDVEGRRQAVLAPQLAHELLQAPGILRGVAQAVDMVEPQALQRVGRDQSCHQRVDRLERRGMLDAQAGEVVDVEKAPVVDRRERDAPIGETVMLPFEQAVQRRGAGLAVVAIGARARARSLPAPPAMAASCRFSSGAAR